MIGEGLRAALRADLGLILHILAAAGNGEQGRKAGNRKTAAGNPPRSAGG
jgi:hypothetical protein